MRIKKNTIFRMNNPMMVYLGQVKESLLGKTRILGKGSILLPYDEIISYQALTDIILSEVVENQENSWYWNCIILRIENQVLRENDPVMRFLLYLYSKYLINQSLIIQLTTNKKRIAEILNFEAKVLSEVFRIIKDYDFLLVYTTCIEIKDIDKLKEKISKA